MIILFVKWWFNKPALWNRIPCYPCYNRGQIPISLDWYMSSGTWKCTVLCGYWICPVHETQTHNSGGEESRESGNITHCCHQTVPTALPATAVHLHSVHSQDSGKRLPLRTHAAVHSQWTLQQLSKREDVLGWASETDMRRQRGQYLTQMRCCVDLPTREEGRSQKSWGALGLDSFLFSSMTS